MYSTFLKIAALVALTVTNAQEGDITRCGPSDDLGFTYQVNAADGFDIHWSMDSTAGTITFKAVSAAMAWTGIGFSDNGIVMPGSDAVVGLPSDGNVLEMDLIAYDDVVPYAEQELTEATISQDGATGTSTLIFTRPMVPAANGKTILSETPGNATVLLWSHGTDNALGYHGPETRGGLVVDLFCGDMGLAANDALASPSPAAMEMTMAPTSMMMETPTPSPAADGDRGIDASAAPTASGGAAGETGAAARVGSGGLGGRWAAAAVTGVVTVLAVLAL